MKNEIHYSQTNKETIKKSCAQTQAILSELHATKEALVEKILGTETYRSARTLIEAHMRPNTIMGEVSKDIREQLFAMDKAEYVSIVRDALNLEPTNDEEHSRKTLVLFISENLYPDTPTLSLIDDEEKLGEIGVRLKAMETDDEIGSNELVEQYEAAQVTVDQKIRDVYVELTGKDDIEQIYSDESTFDVDFVDEEFEASRDEIIDDFGGSTLHKMTDLGGLSKNATNISITRGKLFLNSQEVTQLSEVDEVVDTTLPLTSVIELLQQELY